MPSFVITSLVVALYEPVRIPPEVAGLKGFNIYHATLPLQNSDIPVCIAHRTLKHRCSPGTVAFIRGNAVITNRSLLITASMVIPAAIQSAPGPFPPRHHCLPRVVLDGFISSDIKALETNRDCIIFDVTIARRDIWPGTPLTISCWIHRDRKRFCVLEHLSYGLPIVVSGMISGWTWDDKAMLDVHTIAYNNDGSPPAVLATDPANPFARAVFKDGFALFPIIPYDRYNRRSVLSRDALPTREASHSPGDEHSHGSYQSDSVTRIYDGVDVERDRTMDEPSAASPDVLALPEKFESAGILRASHSDGPEAVSNNDCTNGPEEHVPPSEGEQDQPPTNVILPSVDEVRHAAVQKLRSRVLRSRKSSRVSTPDTPLRKQVKLRISARQLATITA